MHIKTQTENLKLRVLKGITITLGFSMLNSPLGYFLRIILAKHLSINEFGLFYSLLAFIGIFIPYLNLGFFYSLTYLLPKYQHRQENQKCNNLFWYTFLIQLIIALIVGILIFSNSSFIAKFYFKLPITKLLFFVFAFLLVVNSQINCLQSWFVGLRKEFFYSLIEPLRIIITLAIFICLLLLNKTTFLNLSAGYLIGYSLTLGLLIGLVISAKQIHLAIPTLDLSLLKEMSHFAFPNLLSTTVNTFIASTDVFLLTIFQGVKAVAIYNIILPIASIGTLFINPLTNLFMPLVSHLDEANEKKIVKLFELGLKFIPLVGLYFGVFISTFSKSSIEFLFGSRWIFAANSLSFFTVNFFFQPILIFVMTIATGLGMPKERLGVTIVTAIINILLCGLLIPKYSINGLIVANFVFVLLSIFLYLRLIKTKVEFQIPWQDYLNYLFFFGSLFTVLKILNFDGQKIIYFWLSGFFYSITTFIFAGLLFRKNFFYGK